MEYVEKYASSAQSSASAAAESAAAARNAASTAVSDAAVASGAATSAQRSAAAAQSSQVSAEKILDTVTKTGNDFHLEISGKAEQVRKDAAETEKHARDAQIAAEQAKVIATSSDVLEPLLMMLASGNVVFTLLTSDGSVLCASDDEELVANARVRCTC